MSRARHAGPLPDYKGAREYALTRLQEGLPPDLLYHSVWHTRDEVADRAEWLAEQEGLPLEARVLAGTAGCYHDLGLIRSHRRHEAFSAQIAAHVLPTFGYTPIQVEAVCGMILATALPQSPHNILEAVVADADLDVLGRDDFFARNRALRAELEAMGLTFTDGAWYTQQLRFLRQHHYFTPTARLQRTAKKLENARQLKALIAACSPYHSDVVVGAGTSPSLVLS